MALDIVTLQKSDQNVRQKVSSPPHSPAAVPPPPHSPATVPPRKYAPSIARSNVVAHSPSVPVRPLRSTTLGAALTPRRCAYWAASARALVWSIIANAAQSGCRGSTCAFVRPHSELATGQNAFVGHDKGDKGHCYPKPTAGAGQRAGSQKNNEGTKASRVQGVLPAPHGRTCASPALRQHRHPAKGAIICSRTSKGTR